MACGATAARHGARLRAAPSATIQSLLQEPGINVREYDSKRELHEEFDWESFLDIEASSLLKFLGLENSPDVRPGLYAIAPLRCLHSISGLIMSPFSMDRNIGSAVN